MKRRLFLLLFCFLSIFEFCSSEEQYTNFKLVFIWPPTHCKRNTCYLIPRHFIVHGIWPTDTGEKGPNHLTDNIILKHRDDLDLYWPDLRKGFFEFTKKYWHRAYESHGVFCTETFHAEEYILLGLTLAKGHLRGIRDAFIEEGIFPHETRSYPLSVISDAIKTYSRSKPELVCTEFDGKQYLVQIRLCIEYRGIFFVDCDDNGNYGCPEGLDAVIIPQTSNGEEMLDAGLPYQKYKVRVLDR